MRTTCPSCPQKVKKLIVGKKPIHAWPSGMGPPAHHSGLWQAELAGGLPGIQSSACRLEESWLFARVALEALRSLVMAQLC